MYLTIKRISNLYLINGQILILIKAVKIIMNCLKQLLSEKELSDYVPDHAVKTTEWIARFIIS